MAWLDAQEPGDLYVTAITAEELLFGALILPAGHRRTRLVNAIEAMLRDAESEARQARRLAEEATLAITEATPGRVRA